jgi:hypothetical protein
MYIGIIVYLRWANGGVMSTDTLKVILFVTSSLRIEKYLDLKSNLKFSSLSSGNNIVDMCTTLLGGNTKIWVRNCFEKLREPTISQDRQALGHEEEYIPPVKEPKPSLKTKVRPPSKGRFLNEDKTPSCKEIVPEKNIVKDVLPEESMVKEILPEIQVEQENVLDQSVSFEDVKVYLKDELEQKTKLSTFDFSKKETINGVEIPTLLLVALKKIQTAFFGLSKTKKVLLFAGGTAVTFFVVDKILSRNIKYKTNKEKLLKKVSDLFQKFRDNLPRT